MSLAILALALALAADVDPEPPGSSIKVLASADWAALKLPPRQPDTHTVARCASELIGRPRNPNRDTEQKIAAEVNQIVKRGMGGKSVDWDRQMVLVVAAGQKPSGGYSVEVKGVKVRNGTLVVSWRLRAPVGGADDVITYPATAVLVPAHKGKVVFEQVK